VGKDKLYDYISSQALEWFQFSDGYRKNRRYVSVPNGNLCLVTGVDKVPEWSVLSFWKTETDVKGSERKPFSSAYTYGSSNPWSTTKSEGYTTSNTHCREAYHGGKLASAFIRGIRIAISPSAWEEYLPTEISDSIYNIPTGPLMDTSTVTPDSFVRSLRKVHPEISRHVIFHPSFIIIQMMLAKVCPNFRRSLLC